MGVKVPDFFRDNIAQLNPSVGEEIIGIDAWECDENRPLSLMAPMVIGRMILDEKVSVREAKDLRISVLRWGWITRPRSDIDVGICTPSLGKMWIVYRRESSEPVSA